MSELKPCPFCGAMPETDGKLVQCYLMPCDFRRFKMPVEAWNARPIEDVLNKRIAELEAERRWIPVSERLPELDQDVLAIVDDDIVIGDFRQEWDGEIYFSRDEVGSTRYVTHWMPMPTFPEVQE